MRVFLDTNIVLDLIDQHRTAHEKAKELMTALNEIDAEIVLSEDMLTTIFYIAKQKDKVLELFDFALKYWIIAPFGKELIAEAINICKAAKYDFEDVLQSLLAKKQHCEIIYTNDKNFYFCGVEIRGYLS